MSRIPDAYDMWCANEARLQRELERCPCCDYCNEYIQGEDMYVIHDMFVCEDCLAREFRRSTDDYRN